jgi:hypothetical protein
MFAEVQSRESNFGLPYSKPKHYHLSYAAPCMMIIVSEYNVDLNEYMTLK